MKYERPRACIHGGVANTKSVIYRTRIQGFSRKTASASGKHLFFGIISAREPSGNLTGLILDDFNVF